MEGAEEPRRGCWKLVSTPKCSCAVAALLAVVVQVVGVGTAAVLGAAAAGEALVVAAGNSIRDAVGIRRQHN